MKRFTKWFLIASLIAIPVLTGLGIYVVHLLSIELDSKFYAAVDSIPTKVYSRVFWLRPKKLISLEELRFRLAERSYREIKNEQPLVQGSFRFDAEVSPGNQRISLFLKNFLYPESVASLFFTDRAVGADRDHTFVLEWHAGEITSLARQDGEKLTPIEAIALEPVLIAQLNGNDHETRQTIPLARIPSTLLQAIVSVEDQRFLEHGGIDPRGILRSIWVNLKSGEYQQGASTITQQMVRNIYLSRQKTVRRKLKEIVMALLIELKFSKDQIIEKYLNEVYFGQIGNLEIRGISQAGKYYFGKSVENLTIAEQALLAALIRGPFYYSPTKHFDRAKQRQELVLQKMLESGVITTEAHAEAVQQKLNFTDVSTVLDKAPYFTDFVKAQLLKEIPDEELIGAGYLIFSTLDTYYQKIAEESVAKGVAELAARLKESLSSKRGKKLQLEADALAPLQGAVVLLDPATSYLLAIVGGKNYRDSNYNRALYMRRQVGSVAKPFVFLAGLLYGTNPDGTPLNAVSKLDGSPFKHKFDNQVWEPKNYEPCSEGVVTLRHALANSINIPTARLAVQVGLEHVVEVMEAAGIEQKLQPLPSLSLGAVEIPTISVARAYTTLANFGMRRDVTSILAITNSEGQPVAQFHQEETQALPIPEVADLVEMMKSVFTEGTAKAASALGFTYPAAGKTGTTNDYRDSWFAGFTTQVVGVAWIGYDRDDQSALKQRTLQKLTGASGALPIWVQIMRRIHAELPERDLVAPGNNLERLEVDLNSGGRATTNCSGPNVKAEYFTQKNKPLFDCQ